jgi:two-component system chemotaxis response regulator CheB
MDSKELIEATCPDCRGPLSQVRHERTNSEYTCLVGHAYSALALLQAHHDTQEKALWAAVLALEETAQIVRAVSADLSPEIVARLEVQVQVKRGQATSIRKVLEQLEPFYV